MHCPRVDIEQSPGLSLRKTPSQNKNFPVNSNQSALDKTFIVTGPWYRLRFYKSYYIPYSKSVSPPDSAANSVILVSISSNPLSTTILHPLSLSLLSFLLRRLLARLPKDIATFTKKRLSPPLPARGTRVEGVASGRAPRFRLSDFYLVHGARKPKAKPL